MCLAHPPVTPFLGQPGEGETPETALKPLQRAQGTLSLQGIGSAGKTPGLLWTRPSVLETGLPQANSKREDTLYILLQLKPNTWVLGNKMCVLRLSWSLFRFPPTLFFLDEKHVCFSIFHPNSWVIQDMYFLSLTYMISTAKYFFNNFVLISIRSVTYCFLLYCLYNTMHWKI